MSAGMVSILGVWVCVLVILVDAIVIRSDFGGIRSRGGPSSSGFWSPTEQLDQRVLPGFSRARQIVLKVTPENGYPGRPARTLWIRTIICRDYSEAESRKSIGGRLTPSCMMKYWVWLWLRLTTSTHADRAGHLFRIRWTRLPSKDEWDSSSCLGRHSDQGIERQAHQSAAIVPAASL